MSATGIDEAKLEAFMGRAVIDMGAIISAPLMVIGEKLGLYKAMAGAGPLSSQEVAERSGAADAVGLQSGELRTDYGLSEAPASVVMGRLDRIEKIIVYDEPGKHVRLAILDVIMQDGHQ